MLSLGAWPGACAGAAEDRIRRRERQRQAAANGRRRNGGRRARWRLSSEAAMDDGHVLCAPQGGGTTGRGDVDGLRRCACGAEPPRIYLVLSRSARAVRAGHRHRQAWRRTAWARAERAPRNAGHGTRNPEWGGPIPSVAVSAWAGGGSSPPPLRCLLCCAVYCTALHCTVLN